MNRYNNTNMELTYFQDNIFIGFTFHNNGNSSDKIVIHIYLPESDQYYMCDFIVGNITIVNIGLEGIYKMLKNAIEAKPNYSIKWELIDFRVIVSYNSEIIEFSQVIIFDQIYDTNLIKLRCQLFKNNQEIDSIKKNSVPVEKFDKLVKEFNKMTQYINKLSNDFDSFKKETEQRLYKYGY